MSEIVNQMREVAGANAGALTDAMLTSTEPFVMRGLVAHWPMVKRSLDSAASADAYLRRFYRDASVTAMHGAPEIGGRFFYN